MYFYLFNVITDALKEDDIEMIKKILCAILICFASFNSYAKGTTGLTGITIQSERALNVLRKHFPDEVVRGMIVDFIYQRARENESKVEGHVLHMEDISELCHYYAGWDLNTEKGKKKCQEFVYEFRTSRIDKYYYV